MRKNQQNRKRKNKKMFVIFFDVFPFLVFFKKFTLIFQGKNIFWQWCIRENPKREKEKKNCFMKSERKRRWKKVNIFMHLQKILKKKKEKKRKKKKKKRQKPLEKILGKNTVNEGKCFCKKLLWKIRMMFLRFCGVFV